MALDSNHEVHLQIKHYNTIFNTNLYVMKSLLKTLIMIKNFDKYKINIEIIYKRLFKHDLFNITFICSLSEYFFKYSG